jgi:hypothetical protein
VGDDKDKLPHVPTTLEFDYDMSQWHIARILHSSNYKCHVQQAATNIRCTAWIATGFKDTPTPTYYDRKNQYGSNREIVTDFWFCLDNIKHYMKGTHGYLIGLKYLMFGPF